MKVVLENLTKVFPSRDKKSGKEVVAVNDFTFEIPDGQLVGLLGPSGCGKSTTLYMISGLQKPTSGKIFFGDDDVTELSTENRGIGLVFQNYALYPHMTVMQNIMFPLQNLKGKDKLTKTEMIDRAYEAAKLVQIDELMDRKPSVLPLRVRLLRCRECFFLTNLFQTLMPAFVCRPVRKSAEFRRKQASPPFSLHTIRKRLCLFPMLSLL